MSSMEEFLRENGYVIRPIQGRSMLPMLEEATDAVRLVPVTRELAAGDIPLYRRPNGTHVLHRILKVKKKYYLIRGDNCAFVEKVPKGWVIAVVEGYSKRGTYIPITDEGYRAYVREVLETNTAYERVLAHTVAGKGRVRTALSLLFPPYSAMRDRHPSLRYLPFLLPIAWLVRLIRTPFTASGRRFLGSTLRTVLGKKHAKA